MKSADQILEEVAPHLAELELTRQECLSEGRSRRLMSIGGGFLIGCFTSAILLNPIPLFVGIVLGLVVGQALASGATKHYAANYKSKVVNAVLQSIDSELSFAAEGGVSEEIFVSTGIWQRRPDRYRAEDLITGRYGDTDLHLSEVDAEYRTTDSEGRSRWHQIFNGVLMVADFHKHFTGITVVQPGGGTLTKFFGDLFGNSELVRLEDPEFDRSFTVRSTDQVEARYILSTSMVARILDLRARLGRDLFLSFVGSCVCLGIPSSHDHFDPDPKIPADDRAHVKAIINEVAFFLGLVEDLDLNTRIWSKEPDSS